MCFQLSGTREEGLRALREGREPCGLHLLGGGDGLELKLGQSVKYKKKK